MALSWDDLLKLGLALLLGGIIGAEREYHDKAAGLRTIIFICVGATLFTMLSKRLSTTGDPGRIAANIVSGVGFLGAGTILHQRGQVKGLTTAATVWLVAAIGMAIGSDQWLLAIAGTVVAMIILAILPAAERLLTNQISTRIYLLTLAPRPELVDELRAAIDTHRLRVLGQKLTKTDQEFHFRWVLSGKAAAHRAFQRLLLAHAEVVEFKT